MRIEAIDLKLVRMELSAPFTTSFGTTQQRSCIIIAVHAEGETGLGECVAFDGPWYSYETTNTAWHVISDFLAPLLLQVDIVEPEDVWTVFAPIRGHNMAKAAIEMACWDLIARRRAVSLATLLGGTQDRVPVGVSVGIHASPDALIDAVGRFLADGYRRIKLKIGPGSDLEFVAAVRETFSQAIVQVDANSAYTLADTPTFRQMDRFDLLLVEQPLGPDDIVDHSWLQREVTTPLCLDESIHSPDDARHALDLGSCRIINIKPGRVGGHTQSRAIHDLCVSHGAPVWCGGMLETNVGRAHNVALASLPGFSLPGDISASARYYEHDIAGPAFVLNEDSTLTVPGGPGIGVNLDQGIKWERCETFRARHQVAMQ